MLGGTIALLGLIASSARVIGWILAAATLAGLLSPLVQALDRRVPHALALLAVVVGTIGFAGVIGYAVVDDIAKEIRELDRAVPAAARQLESSPRFGPTATELRLGERAERFVDELPKRLAGGDVQDALRSAATRGVAFLATTVLTIFFIIHGPRLVEGAARQLPPAVRPEARRVAAAVYGRTWHYVFGSLGLSAMAGLLAYGCARVLDTPGKAPLALWMAVFDLVPLVGVVLGAIPLVLLIGATEPWPATATVAAVMIGWQFMEGLRLRRWVEGRSLHLGPFVTLAVGMVGLELYGSGGVFVGLVLVVVVAALLDETLGRGPRSSAYRPEA
jgi:predicted PurR-regulated permease PerM